MLIRRFVGWSTVHFQFKRFMALESDVYKCMYCYDRCHGNAIMGFWTFLDNVYDYLFTTVDFPIILDGQFINIIISHGYTL
jgi:uncharacterized membrane protein YpjA